MRRQVILTAIMTLLLFVFTIPAGAETEGYDENTEITVKGLVKEITSGMHNPVILTIKSEDRIYSVVTAPVWYLRMEKINFYSGEVLEIRGSKYFSKDGLLYIIAKRIRNEKTGREVLLRDVECKPMWRGMRNRH